MNVGEILIWESSNLLLLIPVVIGLVMLVRWLQGRAVFTERDWLLLFGHPREKVFTLRLWVRFAVLLLAVVVIDSPRPEVRPFSQTEVRRKFILAICFF